MTTENEQLGSRWASAFASGDLAGLAAMSSSGMRIWHSHDDHWMSREEGAAEMEAISRLPRPVLREVRSIPTATGFVVQAWVEGETGGNGKFHLVQVCTIEDGLVSTCEEYIAPTMTLGSS